jgi:hypothetical protein
MVSHVSHLDIYTVLLELTFLLPNTTEWVEYHVSHIDKNTVLLEFPLYYILQHSELCPMSPTLYNDSSA